MLELTRKVLVYEEESQGLRARMFPDREKQRGPLPIPATSQSTYRMKSAACKASTPAKSMIISAAESALVLTYRDPFSNRI